MTDTTEVSKKKFQCQACNRIFNTKNALRQHCRDLNHGYLPCTLCKRTFLEQQALVQHIKQKHTTTITKNQSQPKMQKSRPQKESKPKPKNSNQNQHKSSQKTIPMGIYDRTSIWEKITNVLRQWLHCPRILLLDECVGNKPEITALIDSKYLLKTFPEDLRSHPDEELLWILKAKKWGLVTLDKEFAIYATNMKISPIYLYVIRNEKKALIRMR